MNKLFVFYGACLLLLGGCSVKLPPVNKYQLDSFSHKVLSKYPMHESILVSKVKAASGYDDEKMRYIRKPFLLESFAKNEWVADPADMLQTVLIQSLTNTRLFKAVIKAPFSGKTSYRVDSQLIEIKQNFLVSPSRIDLIFKVDIVSERRDMVISSRRFVIKVNAPEQNPYGGVLAANQAVKILMEQLMLFIKTSLA